MNIETEVKIAWLAGLWDGEGSISLVANKNSRNGTMGYRAMAQMNMTCGKTIEEVGHLLSLVGVTNFSYVYSEKKSHHKDAHLIRINRMDSLNTMAKHMVKYSVTKRRQWEIMLEYTESRLEGVTIKEDGTMIRGGSKRWWRPYNLIELSLIDEIRELNKRGVAEDAKGNRKSTIKQDRVGG